VTLNADDRPFTPEELAEAAARADVLIPTITDRVDAQAITRGSEAGLKLIANYGAGYDHIDVCIRRGREACW
jgi:glyoxylate reductase